MILFSRQEKECLPGEGKKCKIVVAVKTATIFYAQSAIHHSAQAAKAHTFVLCDKSMQKRTVCRRQLLLYMKALVRLH